MEERGLEHEISVNEFVAAITGRAYAVLIAYNLSMLARHLHLDQ